MNEKSILYSTSCAEAKIRYDETTEKELS